ncbi:long-chain fatty acid--CoA ligase [Actinomadura roseirufa]|uniref:long-chain fatty acid--CoA ligase n=1 Tax=Actinomadura roseirufa TaxID=2094049 RepID=UPI0013F14FEC|nr:long-chain fatty acid--CoA ligase [Actinomadura roseirufa]
MASDSPIDPLDAPWNNPPDSGELISAAMDWHFSAATGSAFWLDRADGLAFDPRKDVRTVADLRRFPNIVDELRDVRVEDLIPRGYGGGEGLPLVGESGGTTGPPKRVVWTPDVLRRATDWHAAGLAAHGPIRPGGWLCMGPTDPHMAGTLIRETAGRFGAVCFLLDLDPRWVKRCIARGALEEVALYVEHVVDQAEWILRSQDIAVLYSTPPLLEALCHRKGLAELVNERTQIIGWGGTKMDTATRDHFQREVFPDVTLVGGYASTMIIGGVVERAGAEPGSPAVFDPPSPFTVFSVIDPATGESVPYGERGQVLQHHLSRGMFLPNNLERDSAIRVPHVSGRDGDAIADVHPIEEFSGKAVIEGVY